jgi:hypothetical protein
MCQDISHTGRMSRQGILLSSLSKRLLKFAISMAILCAGRPTDPP